MPQDSVRNTETTPNILTRGDTIQGINSLKRQSKDGELTQRFANEKQLPPLALGAHKKEAAGSEPGGRGGELQPQGGPGERPLRACTVCRGAVLRPLTAPLSWLTSLRGCLMASAGAAGLLRGHCMAVLGCQTVLASLPSICARDADSCWRQETYPSPCLPVSLPGGSHW